MKRLRFLVVVTLIAFTLIGTGYASWQDTLVTSNTVSTGELSVELDNEKGEINAIASEQVKPHLSILEGSKAVEVSFDNMYPGSYGAIKLQGKNTGTIPCKFDSIQLNTTGDTELIEYFIYEGGFEIDGDGDGVIDKIIYSSGLLKDFESNFNKLFRENLKDTELSPNGNGKFYFKTPTDASTLNANLNDKVDNYVVLKLREDAPIELQNKNLSFEIKLNFSQFNVE